MTKHNDQERALFEAWWATCPLGDAVDPNNPAAKYAAFQVWQARAQLPTSGGAVPDAHVVAQQVRTALDRQACPNAWMMIAYEAVVQALTAAPHTVSGELPAAQDVSGLVEALDYCERWFLRHSPTAPLIGGFGDAEHPMLLTIRNALAAHRAQAQGGEA